MGDRETRRGRGRQTLLSDAAFKTSPLAPVLDPFRDDFLFHKLAVWNVAPTSNDVEGKNHEFRKRHKARYRMRSLDNPFALLDRVT